MLKAVVASPLWVASPLAASGVDHPLPNQQPRGETSPPSPAAES